MEKSDNLEMAIEAILRSDAAVQHLLRINWPESWLKINLPLGSTRALFAIEGFDARTPGRVAEVLGLSRTTVTGVLDRLEQEQLIARRIAPEDRRSFVLEVTEQGRTLLRSIEAFREEQLERALRTMEPSALADLERGIAALSTAVRAVVDASTFAEGKNA